MNTKRCRSTATALTLFCVLAAFYATGTSAGPAVSPAPAACEGDACAAVTLAFDEAEGQYRVRNNSAERWVKVAASNVAAYADACVGPGKTKHLPLRSISGSYRADYAEPRCGVTVGE